MSSSLLSITLLLPLVASFFGGGGQVNTSTINADCLRGNGRLSTETRQVSSFTSLEVEGSFVVTVRCQQGPSLTIKAESNLLPHIGTEQHGSTLKISARRSICANKPLVIVLTTKQLGRLQAEGANELNVSDLTGDDFKLDLLGAGDVQLAGTVERFRATIDGSADLQAGDLQAAEAKIVISGAASAQVRAEDKLEVNSSGASELCYNGNPAQLSTEINGVGDVGPCSP